MEKRKELAGVLIRILVYVIVMRVFEDVNDGNNTQGWRMMITAILLGLLLIGMAKENDYSRLGLTTKTAIPWKTVLFLLPMVVVASVNLWHGIDICFEVLDMVWYILSMIFIGFIEEILFRGYLLQLLLKKSVKVAIIVSSLTFGLGHVVNLLNGAEVVPTILQLVYAICIGLMLSVFMVKVKHLLPCCFFHGMLNALAAFSNENGQTIGYQVTVCVAISVISVAYAWLLWRRIKGGIT